MLLLCLSVLVQNMDTAVPTEHAFDSFYCWNLQLLFKIAEPCTAYRRKDETKYEMLRREVGSTAPDALKYRSGFMFRAKQCKKRWRVAQRKQNIFEGELAHR